MENRRNFLKVFGLSSAAVVGVSGEHEIAKADTRNPLPAPMMAGDIQDWKGPKRDVVSACLYDRLDIPAGPLLGRYRFFDRGWTSNRGLEETNVYSAMRLDAPTLFQSSKIGITFAPDSDFRTMKTLLNRYKLFLWLGNKYYCQVPLVEAFGPPNSDPLIPFKTLYALDLPIVIGFDHNFHMDLVGTETPYHEFPGISLWGVQHGRMARGI